MEARCCLAGLGNHIPTATKAVTGPTAPLTYLLLLPSLPWIRWQLMLLIRLITARLRERIPSCSSEEGFWQGRKDRAALARDQAGAAVWTLSPGAYGGGAPG